MKVRIALAQINPLVGDLMSNADKITEYIRRARQSNVDIVAFPELALTGYPPEDLLLKPHFVKDSLKALKKVVAGTKNIIAVVGCLDWKKEGGLYNAAAVIQDGKIKAVYHKVALPNYGVFDEKRYFQPGKGNLIISLGKIRMSISICEDMWIEDGPFREQTRAGSSLLLNISSSPFHAGKRHQRRRLLQAIAKKYRCYVGYVNLIGGQDELVFDGNSFVVSPKGYLLATAKAFQEDFLVIDLDLFPRKGQKGLLKECKLANTHVSDGRITIRGRIEKPLSSLEEIYEALVLGTRDYVKKNGFKKVVVGLSGGIDSSLVACIAVDALGKENVIGVTMPSVYTSQGTRNDAGKLAENLGIRLLTIPIKEIFQAYGKTLKKVFSGCKPDITEENLQARIRGNILMALSNKFGWLVLSTGNKSEVAVGYCTLYGDMAGGFSVIKDVPKTKVYALAHWRNKKSRRELIPRTVFRRPPTAELRKNQKDQDTLPPYDILDRVLEAYVERDKSPSLLKKAGIAQGIIDKVVKMVDRNEYKRRQAPPGVKITPKAFGRDRRMPLTNGYKKV